MEKIKEEVVRIAAKILGPHSAAAKAMRDAEQRQSAGEEVLFFRRSGSLIVVNAALIEGASDGNR